MIRLFQIGYVMHRDSTSLVDTVFDIVDTWWSDDEDDYGWLGDASEISDTMREEFPGHDIDIDIMDDRTISIKIVGPILNISVVADVSNESDELDDRVKEAIKKVR